MISRTNTITTPAINALLLVAMSIIPRELRGDETTRDQEVFGDTITPPTPQTSPAQELPSIAENLQIGGRLEMRSATGQQEHQEFPEASYQHLKRADIYFDSRPNQDLRTFLRLRFSEETPANVEVARLTSQTESCATCIRSELDEMWFKWDISQLVFVTAGKQHLKWGSGRLWNPTDFTSTAIRDPFTQFDSRLGQNLIKVHVPFEKNGYNFYSVLQFDEMKRNDDVGAALRGEFAFLGSNEAAVSFHTRRESPIQIGLDYSGAAGPLDLYAETAWSKRQQRYFYSGTFDPETMELPSRETKEKSVFNQSMIGVQYTHKYSDEDNVTLGLEIFENGLGYEDRELGLMSLLTDQSQPLYTGRRYLGGYIRLPAPLQWNDTTFFLTGIRNQSDGTGVARLSSTVKLFKELDLEGYVSQCFGDYGELCFRVPEKYKLLAVAPDLTNEQKLRAAALPTKRTKTTAGIGVSASF